MSMERVISFVVIMAIVLTIRWVVHKFSNMVINSREEVLYPKVKVKLVGMKFEGNEDLMTFCAAQMMIAEYSDDEVREFLKKAKQAKDFRELLNCCYQCFYIY